MMVYDYERRVKMRVLTSSTRGPKKYTGVGLKADSNEVTVEGITLCHEGFEMA